jgi:hypothetical protein
VRFIQGLGRTKFTQGHVTPVVITLAGLTFSSTSFQTGVPSTGTINGATIGSTITATGLPSGLTINGTNRTWAWDGSSGTSGALILTETLPGAVNSPNNSSISFTIATAATGRVQFNSAAQSGLLVLLEDI